jgi:histidinol-phosphatase (PHP family)
MNDYHVHSFYCRHGEGRIHEYVEQAIAKNCREIGFAEHIPIPELRNDTGRMVEEDFASYVQDVEKAQMQYPEITVRLGLEADYIPKYMNYTQRFISSYDFDFIIGSVHYIGDWDFSNPDYLGKFSEMGIDATWRTYYQLVAEAAATGLFDMIGHFDMPKKYENWRAGDVSKEIDHALHTLRRHNLALDVNTSGRRRAVAEIHPSPEILAKAFTLGIPVVLGSDAHRPADVAFYFKETLQLLQHIGYHETCAFDKRKRYDVPMEK